MSHTDISPLEQAITAAQVAERQLAVSLKASVQCAVELGQRLAELKGAAPHGEFEAVCDRHLTVKPRQRQKYMQLAEGHYSNGRLKAHSSALLDINTEIKLLAFDDAEADAAREDMAALTQKERDTYLKRLAELKEDRDRWQARHTEWQEDAMRYRKDARDGADELARLKARLAEAPKVVYQADNAEAIRQAVEESEVRLRAAKARIKKMEGDQQAAIESGVKYHMDRLAKERETLQDEINRMAIARDRAAKEYEAVMSGKGRVVELAEAVGKIRACYHEASAVLQDITLSDDGWDVASIAPMRPHLKAHIELYQQFLQLIGEPKP